jgi:hypothetical protein
METVSEVQVAAMTLAGVKTPISAACPPAVDRGRLARVTGPTSGLFRDEGTAMSGISAQAHVQPAGLGQTPIRKPNNYMTRVYAFGGGAPGPYPAREPEPV